ncbi:hypothetical protein AAG906_031151 [Vitis piasezkii]
MADEGTKEELHRDLYKALMKGDEKEVIQPCKNIPEGPCVSNFKEKDKTMERDDEGPQVKVCKPISYISDFVRKENTRLESATNLSRFLIRKILPGRLLILVRTGAIEHVYNRGRSILHVAIKHPQIEILSWWKEKARYESALKLAKLLIRRDTSWKATKARQNRSKPKTHRYSPSTPSIDEKGRRNPSFSLLSPGHEEKEEGLTGRSQESSKSPFNESGGEGEVDGSPENDMTPIMRTGEIPLFLATRSGIQEIVKEILAVHPQAFEHINCKGKNILHFAIKYRQIEIFNLVVNNEFIARKLVRKLDNEGNSILHMVGKKRADYVPEKIQSPALQLQKELILFERVKEVSAAYFTKHINEHKHTPEELFAETYTELHKSATDWLKRTSENCTVVAALIATVAFAAAYTIPGGPNQNTGFPLLLYQPFFVIFTLSDAVSLTFALTSVVTFLSILTSSVNDMVAFAATIVLMIHNKERWTKIVLYSVAFLPVTVFAISYSPLYLSLLEACKYPLKLIVKACPRCNSSSTNPHKSQWVVYAWFIGIPELDEKIWIISLAATDSCTSNSYQAYVWQELPNSTTHNQLVHFRKDPFIAGA